MANSTSHAQALIFGASGISGWAILQECLIYPTKTTFSRVIGLTNRPLDAKDALMPSDDKRWELHSCFDLTKGVDTVAEKLKGIKDIEGITHVYFASYVNGAYPNPGTHEELKRVNVEILETAVKAGKKLCPKLQFWTLQTGFRPPSPLIDIVL